MKRTLVALGAVIVVSAGSASANFLEVETGARAMGMAVFTPRARAS